MQPACDPSRLFFEGAIGLMGAPFQSSLSLKISSLDGHDSRPGCTARVIAIIDRLHECKRTLLSSVRFGSAVDFLPSHDVVSVTSLGVTDPHLNSKCKCAER